MTFISEGLALAQKLIKAQWLALAILFLISTALGLQLEDALAETTARGDSERIVLALAGGVVDMFEGVMTFMLLSWALPRVRPLSGPQFLKQPFQKPYLSHFFAESLRALGSILLWTLALILPGLFRYVQLIFVPLIVFFDQEYEAGNVDALQRSTQLANRRMKFLIPFMLMTMSASVLLQLAPNKWVELHTLGYRTAFSLVGFLLSVWSYSVIVVLFEQEMRK